MAAETSMWARLGRRGRGGVAAAAIAIVMAAAAGGYWLLRPDYQVLFSDLAPQDAGAMVAELEKLKVPYRLADGETILVPREAVHKTRMKIMARDVPLRGAVGFELFNNSDFGMTEFAQKVNYQRALQGELTRTIMAMEDVQFARVHLAIPEQGLFRKAATKAKASITLSLKPGRALRPEQVSGIQRLVSAAIPDIAAQDVTIVNQQGVALTRGAGGDGLVEAASTRLDSKRAAEEYLARKAADVLDRALGPGQAIASVDVILNHDQSRVTVEDVLPAQVNAGGNPAGVIVRQRQVVRDSGGGATLAAAEGPPRRDAGSGHLEVDYQVGRRTEQVVSAPGSVQRLGIAVVVRAAADKAQLERIKNLVAVAVGYDSDRGDGIAVYSMEQLPAPLATAKVAEPVTLPVAAHTGPAPLPAPAPRFASTLPEWSADASLLWAAFLATLVVGVAIVMVRRRRRRGLAAAPKPAAAPAAPALSSAEREAMLTRVREWIGPGAAEAKR